MKLINLQYSPKITPITLEVAGKSYHTEEVNSHMLYTKLRVTIVTVFAFLASLIGVATVAVQTAQADTTGCTTLSNGSVMCNVTKTASSDANGQLVVTQQTKVTTQGKIALRWQTSTGYKIAGARCYSEPSFADVPRGAKCWRPTVKGFKFLNSGVNAAGQRVYFWDYIGSGYSPLSSTYFYWDAALDTWRKANCGNWAKFTQMQAISMTKVELVKTFSALSVKLTGYINKSLSESVQASVSCSVAGASASATATGQDSLTVKIAVTAIASSYAKAQAAATSKAISEANNEDLSLQSEVNIAAVDNLQVNASASCSSTGNSSYQAPAVTAAAQACVNAGSTSGIVNGMISNPNDIADTAVISLAGQTVTVQVAANSSTSFAFYGLAPGMYTGIAALQTAGLSAQFSVTVGECQQVQHWTQVTCQGFEEISGNGSFLVTCNVQDDNGASIALSVSPSQYYTVSGINCSSQGGTPSCVGDGTYQFRVDGVNNTSNIVQASMTVTATANGVPANYVTDFNVDPASGGF